MREKLIIALGIAVLAFGMAWKVQDWRYGEEINGIMADLAKQQLKAVKAARNTERGRYEQVLQAEKAARSRTEALKVDVARARVESDGLRDALATTKRRLSQATAATCRNDAAVISDLLGSCTEEYRSMAQIADEHANDLRTVIEAWPFDLSK